MNYFAADRPRLPSNGRPMFTTLPYPLPPLIISPKAPPEGPPGPSDPSNLFTVTVWLAVGPNNFQPHTCEVTTQRLTYLLEDYIEDPELILALFFNWRPPSEAGQAQPQAKSRAEPRVPFFPIPEGFL